MTPQLDSVPLLTVAAAAERTRRSTKKRTVSDQKQCATEMTGVHRRRQVAVLRKRQEVLCLSNNHLQYRETVLLDVYSMLHASLFRTHTATA
eukprot:7770-Heterococcus_DN1.PRE.1